MLYPEDALKGDLWQSWEVSDPSQLVPKQLLSKRSQILLGNGAGVTITGRCHCSAVCQLRAPQLCSPSPEHDLVVGLEKDHNWAEKPQAADAERVPGAGKRSRRRGLSPVAIPFLAIIFEGIKYLRCFCSELVQRLLAQHPRAAWSCLMPFKGRHLQSCWKWSICLCASAWGCRSGPRAQGCAVAASQPSPWFCWGEGTCPKPRFKERS